MKLEMTPNLNINTARVCTMARTTHLLSEALIRLASSLFNLSSADSLSLRCDALTLEYLRRCSLLSPVSLLLRSCSLSLAFFSLQRKEKKNITEFLKSQFIMSPEGKQKYFFTLVSCSGVETIRYDKL